jgi:Fe2+ or Zn2+ uptake regulation protein
LSDTGSNHLTAKQQAIVEELEALDVHPTVRSLADRLETRSHRSNRFSDDEVRGLLERLEEKGLVVQEAGDPVRYRLA